MTDFIAVVLKITLIQNVFAKNETSNFRRKCNLINNYKLLSGPHYVLGLISYLKRSKHYLSDKQFLNPRASAQKPFIFVHPVELDLIMHKEEIILVTVDTGRHVVPDVW